MKIVLAYILAVFTVFTAFGRNSSDSVKVYFRINHRQFDSSLGDNRALMDGFVDKVREAVAANDIERLVVRAYASPDGYQATNVQLARYRCEAITNYIVDHTGISRSLVQAVPEGIAWAELRRLVAENTAVPSREKVLDILDNTPVWIFDAHKRIVDGRKKQLMELAGGVPYRWMLNNLFPELRNAVAVSIYFKSTNEIASADTVAVVTDSLEAYSDSSDLVEQSDSSIAAPCVPPPFFAVDNVTSAYHPRVALKTNILYYAALMPNLEFEWLVNDRWSVALEGDVAWWKNDSRHKYYQLAVVSPEVRRWIHPREPWHGMYVGLFAGGGLYDLENKGNGYKGEGGMAGLSFGYMWPIGRNFSLEAGVGAGYMYTRYKEYEPHDGHYIYLRTRSMHYFGPLKLKFSIAWRFGNTNKSKQINSRL